MHLVLVPGTQASHWCSQHQQHPGYLGAAPGVGHGEHQGHPLPCILPESCSSTSPNPQSRTHWAGASTCRPSPQILPCVLPQSLQGDHPQPARLWEVLKGSDAHSQRPTSPFLVRSLASPQPRSLSLSLLLHQRSFPPREAFLPSDGNPPELAADAAQPLAQRDWPAFL